MKKSKVDKIKELLSDLSVDELNFIIKESKNKKHEIKTIGYKMINNFFDLSQKEQDRFMRIYSSDNTKKMIHAVVDSLPPARMDGAIKRINIKLKGTE